MSIIQDALKKAQEERAKRNKKEAPYHLTGVQKKPRIVVYATIAVVCAVAVLAYLYIPYFHKPKITMKMSVPAQTATVTKSPEASRAVQSLPEEQKLVNAIQLKENKDYTDQAYRSVNEKSEVMTTAKDKKKLGAVRTRTVHTQVLSPAPSTKRKPALTETSRENVVAESQKTNENSEKRNSNEDADAIYNKALKEQQSGRIKEAKAVYRQVLAIQPNHVETLNNLGVIAIREGNTQEALFYFKRILEYRKDYSKAYNNIGLIAMKDGNHQLAEEYLRKAVSLEPNDAEPYLNLSSLLRSQGKLQEAEKVLEIPIQKRIKDENIFLSYAVIKDNLGQYEDAARYYRQYLSSSRNQPSRQDIVERLKYIEKIITNNQITISK